MSKADTRQERIYVLAEELRVRGAEFDTGDLDDESIESFLQHVMQFESADHRPLREWLAESGFMPVIDPAEDEVAAELRRLIDQLAFMGVFLENTDHLSDRELYAFPDGSRAPRHTHGAPPRHRDAHRRPRRLQR